jgi:TolB-like protein/Flp pilus assembly protein TadD
MAKAAKEQKNAIVTFGPYRLHQGEGRLWRGKQAVKLTPKAFATLSYFVAHPGQLVSKEDLFAALWRQTVVSEATLTSYIQELRRALRDAATKPRYIETVHRRGYRFIAPVAAGAAPGPSAELTVPSPQALPLPDKPSIVVLPFVNMSRDPKQDYFSDGLTDVLTGDLSLLSSLFVIARNSAFTYKGKTVKVQDVGREMGVRYVLEGSVQKANQRVRITTQLIEAATGGHLWSERYDRPLKDIFALQDEIVQKIVTTLKLQLTLEEQGYIVRKHTDNLEAYDTFLRGREYAWRFTQEAFAQARQLFEKALALDPQYAEAYAWLGWTYYMEWAWRWSADPQALERALALAQQAVALDDSLSIAHSVLSNVSALKGQYDQAIAEGERAIALAPNDAESYSWQAETLSFAGRPEEALRAAGQAMRLNPHYPPTYLWELGWAYRGTGRYAEAIATLQELISRRPNFLSAHLILADSYLQQWVAQQSPAAQTLEPAVAAAQRALALSDSLHWSHIFLGHIDLYQQQYEQALAEMERAVALAPLRRGAMWLWLRC